MGILKTFNGSGLNEVCLAQLFKFTTTLHRHISFKPLLWDVFLKISEGKSLNMTPSRKKAADTFEKVANEKNINLEKVDINWLGQMLMATQMCNYKTEKLFIHFVEHALTNIPKQAILK